MSGMVRYCSIQNVDSGKWLFESTDKSGHENKVETGSQEKYSHKNRSKWEMSEIEEGETVYRIMNMISGRWLFESTDKSGHENIVETGSQDKYKHYARCKWVVNNIEGDVYSIKCASSGKWLFESTDKSGHENIVETGSQERYSHEKRSRWRIKDL